MPSDAKSWLIGKDPDAGKDWEQEEKGATEDEMIGWHQWLNRHEFEQALGDGEGQGSLVCCSPWGHKELDMTEQLNNINNVYKDGNSVFHHKRICRLWSLDGTESQPTNRKAPVPRAKAMLQSPDEKMSLTNSRKAPSHSL